MALDSGLVGHISEDSGVIEIPKQGFMQEFWLGGGDEILTATLLSCVFIPFWP